MSEVSFTTVEQLRAFETGALVRVEFENRSAWNATIVHDDEGSMLRWVDLKKGPERDRDFPLIADGTITAETKPAWGAMTRLVARKAR